jgi:molybdopterin synthase catalytic subunit
MLKDLVGRSADDLDVPDGTSLGSVFERYACNHPRLRELAPSIVAARNQEFADPETLLSDGDEVAFLPPVSGGTELEPAEIESAGHYFALTRSPIDTRGVISRILTGGDGGVVTFEGVVRNNTKGRPTLYLDYECYESMALKMMARIGCEIAASYPVTRVAMVHRLGRMLIGETSVAVIVTAPHRKAAFDAALEGINRLKKLVPIWKKEHFVDGEVWVEGDWDRNAPVVG